MAELSPDRVSAYRTRLIDRRNDLVALAQAGADVRAPVTLDQTAQGRLSRMDALQLQAMSREAERRRQAEIGRIDAALARIESGDFGACVRCGEPIAVRRLDHDPSVALCIGCARR